MRNYTIYTCGGMCSFGKEHFHESNEWRLYCQKRLESYGCKYNVNVINPNAYFNFLDNPPKYNSQQEVMNFDLYKVKDSNMMIINFNDKNSLGSMAELAIAYDRRIPIIGLDIDKQELHPWQRCMCERIFTNIDEMLEYIEEFYLR